MINYDEQQRQWRIEMEQNAALQKHFENFSSASVTGFIDEVLRKKKLWVNYGGNYTEQMETAGVEWVYCAAEHLKIIQQKKLFDVQCLWRAEKMEINEVQLCFDFLEWENNILNCPFIEPVNEEDIHLYRLFLQGENDIVDNELLENWQDYDEIKESYTTGNTSGHFPNWYEFHNERTGQGALLALPDIRGQKEEFYLQVFRDAYHEKNSAAIEECERNRDKRPYLNPFDNIDWYVNTFENKEIQRLYRSYKWGNRHNDIAETLDDDIKLLLDAEEYVPIEACFDWQEGLRKAAQKYKNKKISEALPEAWEQYMLNVQTGIAFHRNGPDFTGQKEMRAKNIIEGRILNGEPGNLDF